MNSLLLLCNTLERQKGEQYELVRREIKTVANQAKDCIQALVNLTARVSNGFEQA